MDLLLINPAHIIRGRNIWKKIDSSLPPLGLGYIASFLEQKGIKVNIFDVAALGADAAEFSGVLKNLGPRFVGITATTVLIDAATELAKITRQVLPEAGIVFGGVHSTILPDEVLSNDCVDYVVRGEGEWTLFELMQGQAPQRIAG